MFVDFGTNLWWHISAPYLQDKLCKHARKKIANMQDIYSSCKINMLTTLYKEFDFYMR